jgi:hypothetical protein
MTAGEWDAYGDACASHEDVTIDGVKYRTVERPWMPDLKTGTPSDFSWCAVAMQLASYAHVDEVQS